MSKKKKSKKWNAKQKLKAVSETLSANEAELGTYLRKEGLHSQELNEWQEQALASLSNGKPLPSREEFENLQDEIRRLEREIQRKDKALAEASALLILQKKIALIWGDGEK